MSRGRESSAAGRTVRFRREVLAGVGTVGGAAIAGCSALTAPRDPGPEREVEPIEIVVTNSADEAARLGVRIEGNDGEGLFSRVYRLDSGRSDQSVDVEVPRDATRAFTVHAFTPDGTSETWEHAPDIGRNCPAPEIGIWLREDRSIDSYHNC